MLIFWKFRWQYWLTLLINYYLLFYLFYSLYIYSSNGLGWSSSLTSISYLLRLPFILSPSLFIHLHLRFHSYPICILRLYVNYDCVQSIAYFYIYILHNTCCSVQFLPFLSLFLPYTVLPFIGFLLVFHIAFCLSLVSVSYCFPQFFLFPSFTLPRLLRPSQYVFLFPLLLILFPRLLSFSPSHSLTARASSSPLAAAQILHFLFSLLLPIFLRLNFVSIVSNYYFTGCYR